MTITASRIGNSPITADWTNLVSVPVGPGSTFRGPSPDASLYQETWANLKTQFEQGVARFFDCPVNNEFSQAEESQALAQQFLKREDFTDCLFLGIGGSSLGPNCLLSALEDRKKNSLRFHFMENPDPLEWSHTIQRLSPDRTLVCIVTKSGSTFETLAQALLASDWVGRERLKTHLMVITDPEKGDLRAFANQNQIPALSIHPALGGRFSVFSPVGLFPAALAGLSVSEFLQGAKLVRDYVEKSALEKNSIFILAHELLRHAARHTVHVCMPYSTRLRLFGNWFVQLWGESLGKDGTGFTPVAAVGATDQHSILQLLRDGPDDKVTFFISIDQVDDEVHIPKMVTSRAGPTPFASFKILEGHSLQELLRVEKQATSTVLTKQGRPNFSLQLDRLDEKSMGSLFFTFCVLTSFTGTVMGINPFDQPGVEEGKVYIREALTLSGSPS